MRHYPERCDAYLISVELLRNEVCVLWFGDEAGKQLPDVEGQCIDGITAFHDDEHGQVQGGDAAGDRPIVAPPKPEVSSPEITMVPPDREPAVALSVRLLLLA